MRYGVIFYSNGTLHSFNVAVSSTVKSCITSNVFVAAAAAVGTGIDNFTPALLMFAERFAAGILPASWLFLFPPDRPSLLERRSRRNPARGMGFSLNVARTIF